MLKFCEMVREAQPGCRPHFYESANVISMHFRAVGIYVCPLRNDENDSLITNQKVIRRCELSQKEPTTAIIVDDRCNESASFTMKSYRASQNMKLFMAGGIDWRKYERVEYACDRMRTQGARANVLEHREGSWCLQS